MPGSLPRPVLCARITTLRSALDSLTVQAEADGQGGYQCVGALERELVDLQAQLWRLDRLAALEPLLERAVA